MSRVLSCALCACLCSSVVAQEPVVIDHGPPDGLLPLIQVPSVIVAGEYQRWLETTATLDIMGGTFATNGRVSPPAFVLSRETAPTITVHARYARAKIINEKSDVLLEGWLNDGNFFRFHSSNEFDAPGRTYINITPTDDPLPFFPDADCDQDLDLDDLNTVRNNYGSSGSGDIDENGTVDLDDLNYVRNGFGYDQFALPPSMTSPIGLSHAGLPHIPVPEPSTLALGVMALSHLFWSRFRKSR